MSARGGDNSSIREEWHGLLVKLKSTVEGVLAVPSTNVWSTYGGLDRMCKDVELILNHGLKIVQGPDYGSSYDFWHFIRGLRWLNPSLDPVIEQYHKLTRGGASGTQGNAGKAWLRQSLLEHSLSGQMALLVGNNQHLSQHYEDWAFLRHQYYVEALTTCLRSVEQNKPSLLADVNPALLKRGQSIKRRETTSSPRRIGHNRSASLPVNQVTALEDTMIKRAATQDRLVPQLLSSPKTDSVLTTSPVQATSVGASPDECARDVLREVLKKSGSLEDEEGYYSYQPLPYDKLADPLMNMQIIPTTMPSVGNYLVVANRKNSSMTKTKAGSNSSLNKSPSPEISDVKLQEKLESMEVSDSATPPDSQQTDSRDKMGNKSSEKLDSSQHKGSVKHRNSTEHKSSSKHKVKHTGSAKQSHSSELLDTILNSDDVTDSADHKLTTVPKSVSHDSGFTSQGHPLLPDPSDSLSSNNDNAVFTKPRKFTHHRSASDYGISEGHHQRADGYLWREMSNGRKEPLSSSLPTNEPGHFFQQPVEGQSLMSFLSSQDFHTCADQDKENAHFSISEALIAAIEQMKWNQVLHPPCESEQEGDSDEEIQQLKQRIRIRRRERMHEKVRGFPAFSDGHTDTTASVTSISISSTSDSCSASSKDSSEGSEEIHDSEIADLDGDVSSNLTSLKEGGLSLSMASLYSDADLQKSSERPLVTSFSASSLASLSTGMPTTAPSGPSAESVAISLLKRFSESQHPKASDLEWMVSEKDAPQALLPLPDSYPVSPDDNENSDLVSKRTRIRGNLEWAPPRAQIIFNIHPPPKKVILARQNYRCAGCGDKVEPGYIKRYRYCEYLGKYFCPCCHSNDLAYVPGRILRKWDFTKYYVSHFARELLSRIHNEPLFSVEDTNASLYRKVRVLDYMRDWRIQLGFLRKFVMTCRMAGSVQEQFDKLPGHWQEDVHLYTLHEFVLLKRGQLAPHIKQFVNVCVTHVSQCPLCQAKGFVCETCNDAGDVIFPFELNRVAQCPKCWSCYHRACFTPEKCPKCARIEQRKLQTLKQEEEANTSER